MMSAKTFMTKDTDAICGYLTKESLKNPIPPFNNQEKLALLNPGMNLNVETRYIASLKGF